MEDSSIRALRENYSRHYLTSCAQSPQQDFDAQKIVWKKRFTRWLPTSPHTEILDVACGAGGLLYFLREMGYRNVLGVDRDPALLSVAKSAGLAVEEADVLEFLERAGSAYDLIFCVDFLEHLPKPAAIELVQLLHRRLKEGGTLILQTINSQSFMGARLRYADLTHELSFTPASLAFLLKVGGFEKIELYPMEPVIHGVKSLVRRVLWKAMALLLRFLLMVQTGSGHDGYPVYTPVMMAVVKKSGKA